MSEPAQLAESRSGWSRRSRRYSPFNRSRGLRRVPDEPIGFAVVCSLLFHATLIFALVQVTDAPPWSPGADTSLVSMADLVASVPTGPQRADADSPGPASVDHSGAGRSKPSLSRASTVRAGMSTPPAPRQLNQADAKTVESPQLSLP